MRFPHIRALSLLLLGALPHVARAQRASIPLTPVAELLGEDVRDALFNGKIGEARLTAAIAKLEGLAAAAERSGDRAEAARRYELAATLDVRLRSYLQRGDSAGWARVARQRIANLTHAAGAYLAAGDTVRRARTLLQLAAESGRSEPVDTVIQSARALPNGDKVLTLLVLERLLRSQYDARHADTVLVVACRQFCGAYATGDSLGTALRLELASPDEGGCGCGPVANGIRTLLLRASGLDPISTAMVYGLQSVGGPVDEAADTLAAHGRRALAAELLTEAAGTEIPGTIGGVLFHAPNAIAYLAGDAADHAARALSLRAPGDSLGRARSLGLMGLAVGMNGRPDSGAVLLRDAEATVPRAESGIRALMIRRRAVLLALRGDSLGAERLLREAITMRGSDSTTGAPYDRMRVARALAQRGAWAVAAREGGLAFGALVAANGSAEDRIEAATAYALALRGAGRVDSSIAVFEYAAREQARIGEDDPAAESFAAAAEMALEHGQRARARELLARALPFARRDPDFVQPAMQRVLNDLGLLALAESRPADAEAMYRAASAARVNFNESAEAAHQLALVGMLRSGSGTTRTQGPMDNWSLAPQRIAEYDLEPPRAATPMERAYTLGLTTATLGEWHRRHGLFTLAWSELHDALTLLPASQDTDALRAARRSMGLLFGELGARDSAAAYAALVGAHVGDGDMTPRASDAIRVAARQKGFAPALAAESRELARAKATGDHLGAARSYGAIGYLHFRLRSPADPTRGTAYYDSAFAELRAALDTADVAWSAVTGRVVRLPDPILVGLSDEFSLLQGEAVLAWLARAPRLGSGPAAFAALAAAERGRNLSFAALAGGRGVLTRGLAQQIINGAVWTQPLPSVGRELATDGWSYTRRGGVTGAASLSYVMAGDTLVTWLYSGNADDIRVFRRALTADSLAALVTAARASLGVASPAARAVPPLEPAATRGVDDDEAAAGGPAAMRALAAVLVPPALAEQVHTLAASRPWDQLPDSAVGFTVLVIPTGSLAGVPFAALPIDSSGTPLGRAMAVRYGASFAITSVVRDKSTPTLHALADSSEAVRARWMAHAVVVGDPLMPTVSLANGTRARLPQLPAASREADSVAALMGARALHGAAASVGAVRARAGDATVLHLATHGYAFADPDRVGESFVALAPDSADDGLLRVNDVLTDSSFRLVNADLVVLSACQTALGQFTRSEGTLGLQRAFLASGARSVLASLWSVSDEATAMLLESFYRHWLHDADAPGKPEALRRAQNDVRADKRFVDARFWAAFQLVGED